MGSIFAERDIEQDALRICGARGKLGAHTNEIWRVVNSMNWIEAKYDPPLDENKYGKDAQKLVNELCREPMWKCIFRLFYSGYTPAQISKSLKIPYSTAYYYCKRFKSRLKPRGHIKGKWHLNKETKKIEHIKETYAERKSRLSLRKTLLTAAEEKRARKAAKRLEIAQRHNNQQTSDLASCN